MCILTGTSLKTMAKTINNYVKGTWAKSAMNQDFAKIEDHSSWHASRLETIHIIILHAALTDHQVLHCILDPRISRFQHTLPKPKPDCFWSREQNNHGILLQTIHHELIDFASFWHLYNMSPFTVEGYEYRYTGEYLKPSTVQLPLHPLFMHNFPPSKRMQPASETGKGKGQGKKSKCAIPNPKVRKSAHMTQITPYPNHPQRYRNSPLHP